MDHKKILEGFSTIISIIDGIKKESSEVGTKEKLSLLKSKVVALRNLVEKELDNYYYLEERIRHIEEKLERINKLYGKGL